jgi:hypothetical protein
VVAAVTIILVLLWYVLGCLALNTARAAAYRRVHHRVPLKNLKMAAWRASVAQIDWRD